MTSSRAFTLIELMVSASLSIFCLGLVAGAMLHISRLSARTTGLLGMQDSVSAIHRTLAERFEAAQSSTSWHATADPGADAVWGTDDESISVTWMATLPLREDRGYGYLPEGQYDMTWFRLRWQGPKADGGSRLTLSRCEEKRNSELGPVGNYIDPTDNTYSYRFDVLPEPRRDRRRNLNDNDLRTMTGVTAAIYNGGTAKARMQGDDDSLNEPKNTLNLLHPSMAITDCRFSWIDRGGWTTHLTAREWQDGSSAIPAGLSLWDAAGTKKILNGAAWQKPTAISLDGIFLDGRSYMLPGAAPGNDSRDINLQRPALFRIAFTLSQATQAGSGPAGRDPIAQTYVFAIPLTPTLPIP